MTPQERKLIDELFDRLASLERNPRDPEAVRAINEGLQRAPNALYPLVQTALVQDEALKRADARIRELEAELELEPGEPVKQPGFLDNMRDALLGKPQAVVDGADGIGIARIVFERREAVEQLVDQFAFLGRHGFPPCRLPKSAIM